MNTRTKQVLVALTALLAVLVVLGGTKGAQIGAMIGAGESFKPTPEAVTTAPVASASWGSSIAAIGSIQPIMGVVLTAEIPGTVREVRFESGQEVAEGALLLRMDTSTERAELAAAQADATLAEAELGRTRNLLERDARSQADLDVGEFLQPGTGIVALDAIKQASATRLRPILMTTLATVFGHFPLTLVSGPGPRPATASALSWSEA